LKGFFVSTSCNTSLAAFSSISAVEKLLKATLPSSILSFQRNRMLLMLPENKPEDHFANVTRIQLG
jgi:hypothetical protein